ncbi:uncharacterized protein PHALS_14359 [Plasmopara halstedii]|uniref:Uncharacterized protein n=1 Tax=Plasmopara halstedii TaxID=4781 RepID=A0A0P1ARR6_PLAHL|nr:uncharacterized protein PHALS_14359 [Plasmopara halstedii]CEG44092.1 hypothetical protein PHALS_14359 [Plasmopara halstedii]|eukprot:XP_024580461.1 hypothetical protein PHALS_14359 [Plasmopara halstedii]
MVYNSNFIDNTHMKEDRMWKGHDEDVHTDVLLTYEADGDSNVGEDDNKLVIGYEDAKLKAAT